MSGTASSFVGLAGTALDRIERRGQPLSVERHDTGAADARPRPGIPESRCSTSCQNTAIDRPSRYLLKFRSTRIVCTPIGGETGVDALQVQQASHRERRRDHQHERQRDLPGDESAAQTTRRRAGSALDPNGGRTTAPPPPPSRGRWRRPPHRRRRRWSGRDRRADSCCAARRPSAPSARPVRAAGPSSTPAQTADTFSASSCDAMRLRVAPSAARSCSSRQRRVKRVSVRLPTLTQAISSTSAGRGRRGAAASGAVPAAFPRRATTPWRRMVRPGSA